MLQEKTTPSPRPDAFATQAVQLTCKAPQFQSLADGVIVTLRRSMGVPDRAEPEVEAEFAALRQTLDRFFPDFTDQYARVLASYLGEAASVVVASLDDPSVQAYLRAADAIDAEVRATLHALAVRLAGALAPGSRSASDLGP